MAFLYPVFLFGLFALLIPVVIHLFRFKRFKTIYFSNVAFLQSVFQDNRAQSKLKHLLLLATRLLAIFFLVMAFAGPYFKVGQVNSQVEGVSRSIYIDNSLSMGAPGMSLSLLDEAKQSGISLVEAMGEKDEMYVLSNDFEPISNYTLPKQEALYRIQELEGSPSAKSLKSIIDKQRLISSKDNTTALKQYIIASDFREGVSLEGIELDSTEQVLFMPITPQSAENVSLDSIWIEEPFVRSGMRVKIHFRISKNAAYDKNETPVALSIDNEGYASFRIRWNNRVEVDTSINADFSKSSLGLILLSIEDESLSYDNFLYSALEKRQQCQVLEISDSPIETAAARVFGVDSFFLYSKAPVGNVSTEALSRAEFILVTAKKPLSEGLIIALSEQINRGKNVAFFPSHGSTQGWNSVFGSQGLSMFGQEDTSMVQIESVDSQNPFYADLFKEEPSKASWPTVKNSVTLNARESYLTGTLLKSVKGDLLYTRSSIGKGNIFVASFGLNENNTALFKHPIFLPLLYKSALYKESNNPLYYTIGSAKRITTDLEPSEENTMEIAGGEKDPVLFLPEVIRAPGGIVELARLEPIRVPGHYTIKGKANTIERVAFNYARTESVTAVVSADSLLSMARNSGIDASVLTAEAIQNGDLSILEQEQETLWRICILLTLLFLTAEVLITRFIP